jgi:predicted membrane-bound spermidine synthase
MKSRDWSWVILLLFFCSGATALVYEVIWSKFLTQILGSTIYAQTVVLAAFMGGLALGNKLFGGWSAGLRQPVRVYGYLEITIGLYAFFFPTFDQWTEQLFVAGGSGILSRTGWLLAWKGLLSVALLLGPTVLMGGTLPLLAEWLHTFSREAGRRSTLFYAVNSLGAVAGAGLAGFWLVQNLGLIASLQMTALVNVLVGATAGLLSRSSLPGRATEGSQGVGSGNPHPDPLLSDGRGGQGAGDTLPDPLLSDGKGRRGLSRAGAVVALTGAVSMGLEVLSSRSLAMIFGSSVQSFAVVLMAFILGIGLGSGCVALARRWNISDEKLVGLLLSAAGLWVTLLVFNLEHWVDFYRIAQSGLGRTSVGYVYHQLLTTGMSLVVLGVPAACLGAVLPLMIRVESARAGSLGKKVGTLLTWNTLGAVGGTLIAGFILMPWVGLRNAFGALALVLALGTLVIAWPSDWRAGRFLAVGCALFAASLFVLGGDNWRWVISSGVFRSREKDFDPMAMTLRKQHVKILFYEDAADATVSVEQGDEMPGLPSASDRGLRVNGKTDATAHSDLNTQLLLAHLPMLVRPGAKDAFVFGLGSGISAGALLSYPLERIAVAENCEPVIRASKYFVEWNRGVLADRRTHLWHEDARTVLKLSSQLYDIIVAEPSNPWTAGIGSVFSREFYQLAASRLKPEGVMAQWFHVYEMHDGIVELVLRTFDAVFPHVEIWDSRSGDIIMLGSMQPWQTGPAIFKTGFAIPGVQTDLAQIGIRSPEALLAHQLASQRTAFAIPGGGPIQSDLFPLLEYAAPRAFYFGETSRVLEKYDERTRQQWVAPPEKLATLRSLPAKEVQSVFAENTTVNNELYLCVRGLVPAGSLPCVFSTNSPSMTLPASTTGNATNAVRLERAATLLNGTAEQRREGIGLIESAAMSPNGDKTLAAWTSVAASAALSLGELERAARLTALALKLDPEDFQGRFVERIMSRGVGRER